MLNKQRKQLKIDPVNRVILSGKTNSQRCLHRHKDSESFDSYIEVK
jgi:hypothetical protein